MSILNISTFLSISYVILVCVSKYGLARATVSSFETNYGIFDCVDIYKQPAFDNPLLKNHKLQRSPSHLPVIQAETPLKREQGWVGYPINGIGIECPEGTVPIRRAAKEDPMGRNHSSVGLRDYDPFTSKAPDTYYAVVKLKKTDKPYLLAQASISLHRPDERTGASGAQIWMYGGDGGSSNYVSAGWMVDRDLYGDDDAYYTMIWKGDGNTGCANTQCPGYVQTEKGYPPGQKIPVVSTPEDNYYTNFYIYQDLKSKNWWLAVDTVQQSLVPIGYWPKELFSGIKDGGSGVAFGGVARAKPPIPSPPMGIGIEGCNFFHSAYVRRVNYVTEVGHLVQPDWSMTETHVDCPDGYSVYDGCRKKPLPDFGFTYGGKGGC